MLRNRNYLYRSGYGSDFRQVTVPVPVPAQYLDHKKQFFVVHIITVLVLFPVPVPIPVPLRQKVSFPVSQHCLNYIERFESCNLIRTKLGVSHNLAALYRYPAILSYQEHYL